MKDIQQYVSPFVESQFPRHYSEEEKATVVSFMEAFYEYIEENDDTMFSRSRDMFSNRDVDTTLDEFIKFFREKYLKNLPHEFATSDEFAVKKIIDLYRAKGSEKAVKLLVRLLYNTDVDVYYPAKDVLRPSDSVWKEPKYLEVTRSPRTLDFLFTRVTGEESRASAFVESVVTKRVNGKIIDLIYVTDIENGDFQTGEIISNDGNIINSPVMIGSLSTIAVNYSEPGYSIGDRFEVISESGVNGIAKVSDTFEVNDAVNFEIKKSGFGYSLDESQILISDSVLFVENSSLEFEEYETITQTLSSFTVSNTDVLTIGDDVVAYNSANTSVGTGFIVSTTDTSITVETVTGDLKTYQELTISNDNLFVEDENVKAGSDVLLSINNLSGSFTISETVLQRELVNGAYVNIAYGELLSTGASSFSLINSWGTFIAGKSVEGLTSGETADLTGVSITSDGALGTIISSNSTVVEILPVYGEFEANTSIRGEQSKNINLVSSVAFTGVSSLTIANTEYTTSDFQDVSASGMLIGQLSNRIGVYGSENSFYFTAGSTNRLSSSTSNLTKEILRVGNGTGANFELGTLEADTQETVTIKTDIIGDDNIAGVPYTDIVIGTAEDSGVGKISNTAIIADGGSGYSNTDTISFSGGGYANGTPILSAEAEIVTDGSGVITSLNIIDPGQGYFDVPSYDISGGGTGADITLAVDFGYGFPKLPFGDFDDVIDDLLDSKTTTIGEIKTLKNINRGSNYDTNLFVKIVNDDILDFDIEDIILTIEQGVGTLIEGELISAPSGAEGRIETITADKIYVKNVSFETRFEVGDVITGDSTNSTATINKIALRFEEDDMAENAEIGSVVAFAEGIVSEVIVINSGYGYVDNESVTLLEPGTSELAGTGIAGVSRQGISEGFWKTRTSHLNEKFLHDNSYYQEYSYEVQAAVSFEKYEQIIKDTIHVAGTELFGAAYLIGDTDISYVTTSTMSRGQAVEYESEVIESYNIANTLFTGIFALDPTNSGVGRINTSVTINDGGTGYSNTSIVTFTNGGDGGGSPESSAVASIVTDGSGSITEVIVSNRGSGYVTVPTVTFADGSGANVEFEVDYGYGFDKNPYGSIDSILNQVIGLGEIEFSETEVLY